MDCISDFESNHSGVDDSSSPPHTPHKPGLQTSTLHTPPPHTPTHHAPHTSIHHTADDEISTSPSSPEENLMSSRTKTSDWLKAVSLDGSTTSVAETDLSSVFKTPVDSAKKV